jgi:hypothetical protein
VAAGDSHQGVFEGAEPLTVGLRQTHREPVGRDEPVHTEGGSMANLQRQVPPDLHRLEPDAESSGENILDERLQSALEPV